MANDTGGFVLKTQYNTDKSGLEKKFDDGSNKNTNSGLIKKTDYNTKISDTEGKLSSITGSATIAALNAVENKIPNVTTLVQKRKRFRCKQYKTMNVNILSHRLFSNEIIDNKIKQKQFVKKSEIIWIHR